MLLYLHVVVHVLHVHVCMVPVIISINNYDQHFIFREM